GDTAIALARLPSTPPLEPPDPARVSSESNATSTGETPATPGSTVPSGRPERSSDHAPAANPASVRGNAVPSQAALVMPARPGSEHHAGTSGNPDAMRSNHPA